MMADERRLGAYQRALSVVIKPGDVVVDVGAGTGVLSVMAVRAGAARVYAIDRSVPEQLIRSVLEQNGVADRVKIIRGESRDVTLPERGDVVIAEIGFDEETLRDARQRLLRPGGRMVPRIVSVCMAPVHAPALYADLVDFWSDPHAGIDFQAVRQMATNVIHRVSLEGIELLSRPQTILTVDLEREGSAMVAGSATFVLASDRVAHGLGAWHRIELVDGCWHENPPPGPPESWAHSFLPFPTPIGGTDGTQLQMSVIKRGDIWMWHGSCGSQSFDQSTFANMPLEDTGHRVGTHG